MFYHKIIRLPKYVVSKKMGICTWPDSCLEVVLRWLKWTAVTQHESKNSNHNLVRLIIYYIFVVLFAFQASERCNGMILSAYMLKPVQRIPSYRLLLIGEPFVVRDKGVLAYLFIGSHRQLVIFTCTCTSLHFQWIVSFTF